MPNITRPAPCGSCVKSKETPQEISAQEISTQDRPDMMEETSKSENAMSKVDHLDPSPPPPPSSKTPPTLSCTPPAWPGWSVSPPVCVGDYVRSVFLDLCDGKTAAELQQLFPHEWSVLINRVRNRPDMLAELLDMVRQGQEEYYKPGK